MQAFLLDSCIHLAADPIANVRLYLLRLLPRLKQTIRLPDHAERLVRRKIHLQGITRIASRRYKSKKRVTFYCRGEGARSRARTYHKVETIHLCPRPKCRAAGSSIGFCALSSEHFVVGVAASM